MWLVKCLKVTTSDCFKHGRWGETGIANKIDFFTERSPFMFNMSQCLPKTSNKCTVWPHVLQGMFGETWRWNIFLMSHWQQNIVNKGPGTKQVSLHRYIYAEHNMHLNIDHSAFDSLLQGIARPSWRTVDLLRLWSNVVARKGRISARLDRLPRSHQDW